MKIQGLFFKNRRKKAAFSIVSVDSIKVIFIYYLILGSLGHRDTVGASRPSQVFVSLIHIPNSLCFVPRTSLGGEGGSSRWVGEQVAEDLFTGSTGRKDYVWVQGMFFVAPSDFTYKHKVKVKLFIISRLW